MKNILYGTTALVAVSLLAGTAGAAEKIKLGLGGYWRGAIHIGDNDSDANPQTTDFRSHGLGQESEIYFSGKTTLDNGIKFGVMVQLEGETSGDQIDNTYIWTDGSFGRVEFGETWGVSLLMSSGSVGEMLNGHGDFGSQAAIGMLNGLGVNSYGGDAGILQTPDQKIQYFTPRMSGFQLGVSYMPENNTGNNSTGGGINSTLNGNVGNELLDVGANYVGKMGGTDIRVSGSRFVSDTEATAVGAAAGPDADGYSVSGQVGMSGFRIGGRYTKIDDRAGVANTDRVQWRAGVDYASGPYKVGIVYHLANDDVAAVNRDDETRYISVGAQYTMGPGIMLFGGLEFWDFKDSSATAATQGNNTVGVIGTLFSF